MLKVFVFMIANNASSSDSGGEKNHEPSNLLSNLLSKIQGKGITEARWNLGIWIFSQLSFSVIDSAFCLRSVWSPLFQIMAWLTLLIYRDSLQNLPCIWTTVVACVLKRHQITCIWGNYSVFFSGQSQSAVEEFVQPVTALELALQKAAVPGVGAPGLFSFRVGKVIIVASKRPWKNTAWYLCMKEKILLLKSSVILPLMLESWAYASKSVANGLRSWPLRGTVWSFSCLADSDENSSSTQETDFRGGA